MASDFWKAAVCRMGWSCFPFVFIFEYLARALSPATLGRHRLCCCCCCCAAGVAAVVVVVILLLSRLCEDEALSRTQQARYAVVGVFAIL